MGAIEAQKERNQDDNQGVHDNPLKYRSKLSLQAVISESETCQAVRLAHNSGEQLVATIFQLGPMGTHGYPWVPMGTYG